MPDIKQKSLEYLEKQHRDAIRALAHATARKGTTEQEHTAIIEKIWVTEWLIQLVNERGGATE